MTDRQLVFERHVKPIPFLQIEKGLSTRLENLLLSDEILEKIKDFMRADYSESDDLGDIAIDIIKEWLEGVFSSSSDFIHINVTSSMLGRDATVEVVRWLMSNLEQYVSRRGWFILMSPQIQDEQFSSSRRRWNFVLAPNYNERIIEVPKEVYHVTSIHNVKTILRRGLIPKSGQQKGDSHAARNYNPRIYVTGNMHEAHQLLTAFNEDDFHASYMTGRNVQLNQIVLSIDTTKLDKGTKFYVDAEMGNLEDSQAMWTYSSIPARAISITPEFQSAFDEFVLSSNQDI